MTTFDTGNRRAYYDTATHKVVPKDAVVLDLREWPNPARLVEVLRDDGYGSIADQIEAQTKPPRIPEPGLWGVVEAHTAGDSDRRHFGHTEAVGRAVWLDAYGWYCWADLIDPVEVRPGVTP